MKSNNQTIITAIVIAIVGALILTLIPTLPSSISFALGAIAVGAALYFMQTPKEATPIDNTETSQSSKTLYVGNLPYRANETDVKNLFAEHGDVLLYV